jgi:hypothetical protein
MTKGIDKKEKVMETILKNDNLMTGDAQRRIALVAGFGLLLMTVAVGLAEGLAMMSIIVSGDVAITIENIIAKEGLFRFGIFSHLMVVILDIVVAWALYVYLKPLDKQLSLLAAWFRVVYSVFYGIALVNYFQLAQLLGAEGYAAALDSVGLETQVALLLNAFRDVWDLGYVFFGLHLVFLGWVLFESGVIPKWLGILVLIGGISYLIDYTSKILFVDFYPNISLIFGWGELVFMLWLLIRGGKERKSKGA